MNIASFLTTPRTVRVATIEVTPTSITVSVITTTARATCPQCRIPSRRIHSRCRRSAGDLPWQGVAVRLELSVRRFFCAVPTCPQRIFCERLTVGAPHARRTVRLNAALQQVSLALGGEGGA